MGDLGGAAHTGRGWQGMKKVLATLCTCSGMAWRLRCWHGDFE